MSACSYNQVLHFDLMKSGIFSVLPWMTMAVTSNIGGWIADKLVQRGMTVTRVRKIMQSVRVVPP
jgi:MFS transporter, ACS family, solute carrier family 17 (sodium-dependent inorganic phosphate cotransporter), other